MQQIIQRFAPRFKISGWIRRGHGGGRDQEGNSKQTD
jgi:hypothetical protein